MVSSPRKRAPKETGRDSRAKAKFFNLHPATCSSLASLSPSQLASRVSGTFFFFCCCFFFFFFVSLLSRIGIQLHPRSGSNFHVALKLALSFISNPISKWSSTNYEVSSKSSMIVLFRVSEFDMLPGSDVHWWGAAGPDFANLTSGFVIADDKLNKTYKNESFVLQILGMSFMGDPRNGSGNIAVSPDLAPSPAMEPNSSTVRNRTGGVPTMFENCKVLSPNYRVRWTLSADEDSIDIGLEAATGSMNYMAFGWADPKSTYSPMLGADVAVAGFTEDGLPFSDDYYITKYNECMINKNGLVQGVCPDTMYEGSDPDGLVNNTRLVYGHRKDGVSFVRYRRPLKSVDKKYDLPVNHTGNMTVIWALGLIRPPDTLRPYYLPQNHGGPMLVTYGHLVLNVSEHVNDCLGPLDAEDKEDQDLIIADANVPLVVVTSPALHYPNPPNPSKVVDGGLSDMYNNSVLLDDQQVTLFWTLSEDSISIAARGEKKSGYLAIGFGSGMVNSYAYVGWIDNDIGRALKPSCSRAERRECNNIVDPTTPLKVVWAMGAKWSGDHLSERNMHSATSSRPVRVLLMRGSAEAEQDLRPVLAVHGFMMFLAWGILLPGGILAARYLKHVKGDGWFQIHVYLQYSGLAIVLLGFLFAVAELRGFYFSSLHVKFGITAIFLACVQPVNASLRPKRSANGETVSSKRLAWEYLHVIVGRCAIVAGIAALISGMKHLGDRYGGENVEGLNWALIIWFLLGALTVVYLEYREKKREKDRNSERSSWVLGNMEEDDSTDLLSPRNAEKESHPSEILEVQLQPLSR
ncbi:Cytochrome b561, DM13 and DOMON domain-containing protein [Vitis vinifera]|uniref:Cytochrome b561, DM13 and DOMON domain-containing protein n=1 Tax=Vitis vinifera TaxID=29760 RepID=A0A438F2C4_VITVI|nr:Cytochrome b561, DM13 and DOMON domain-containing protein [Vitis vinifera]